VPLPPVVETVTEVPKIAVPPDSTSDACDVKATPIVTSVEAVLVSEPISTVAVIVNVVAAVTVSGVPEIIPVAVSKLRPAGRVPLIA
jgi:hypothetical protein